MSAGRVLRVLVVAPFPPQRDGIGTHTHRLVAALRASSPAPHVTVLTFGGSRRDSTVEEFVDHADAHDGEALSVHRVLGPGRRAAALVDQVVETAEPDVIHYQFAVSAFGLATVNAVLAGLRARRRGAALVFTLHELKRELLLLRAAGRVLHRALARLADAVVVYSAEARDLLVSTCGAPTGKVHLLPHGTEPPRRPASPQWADPSRSAPHRIVCFGYLHPDKGIEHLVEAAAGLARHHPRTWAGTEVLIAGRVRPRQGLFRVFEWRDRAYERRLHAAVDAAGLAPRVRFRGYVPETDVPALLGTARAVVLPYTEATQSGVGNLAMAANAAVVASDLPGLRATFGDGALYVTPGDPEALGRTLGRVLADDALVEGVRARLAAVAGRSTYDVVAAHHLAVYRRVSEQPVNASAGPRVAPRRRRPVAGPVPG